MDLVFKILVVLTTLQRLGELFLAKSNERYILKLGGHIIEEKNYFFMVALHSAWLITLLYLSFFTKLVFIKPMFIFTIIIFLFGQFLRISAIRTLGKRWSTRIVILPKVPAIRSGLFKWIKHPNYLGVVLELAALPLMASLYELAIIFSLINAIILFFRIKLEEQSLSNSNSYQEIFHGQ